MINNTIFTIKNIQKTFRSGSSITYNFELNIKKGSFTFITGDSGIGKSTLIHMLGLLDTAEPMDKDSILSYQSKEKYDFFRISKKKKTFLRRTEFGFLPQGGHLLQPLSIMENLALVFYHRNKSSSDDMETEIKNIMKKVGLNVENSNEDNKKAENSIWNRRNISPINLSGGEKQRLALARTIFCNPNVIFVDEPTTYMDKATARLCIKVLKECIYENDSTIILVTHDYDELYSYIKEMDTDKKINIERYHLIKKSEDRNILNIAIGEKKV